MDNIMIDLEYKHKLEGDLNEIVYQIAKKNFKKEDYKELLEKARSINEQLLVLNIQYRYEQILSENKKNNMR